MPTKSDTSAAMPRVSVPISVSCAKILPRCRGALRQCQTVALKSATHSPTICRRSSVPRPIVATTPGGRGGTTGAVSVTAMRSVAREIPRRAELAIVHAHHLPKEVAPGLAVAALLAVDPIEWGVERLQGFVLRKEAVEERER